MHLRLHRHLLDPVAHHRGDALPNVPAGSLRTPDDAAARAHVRVRPVSHEEVRKVRPRHAEVRRRLFPPVVLQRHPTLAEHLHRRGTETGGLEARGVDDDVRRSHLAVLPNHLRRPHFLGAALQQRDVVLEHHGAPVVVHQHAGADRRVRRHHLLHQLRVVVHLVLDVFRQRNPQLVIRNRPSRQDVRVEIHNVAKGLEAVPPLVEGHVTKTPLLLLADGLLVIGDVDVPLGGTLEDREVLCHLLDLRADPHGSGPRAHHDDVLSGEVQAPDEPRGVACLPQEILLARDLRNLRVAQLPHCPHVDIGPHCLDRAVLGDVFDIPCLGALIPRGALDCGLRHAVLGDAVPVTHPLDVLLHLVPVGEVLLPIRVWVRGKRIGDGGRVTPHPRIEVLMPRPADVRVSLQNRVWDACPLATQGRRYPIDTRATDRHMELRLRIGRKVGVVAAEVVREPAHLVHDVLELQRRELLRRLDEAVQRHRQAGVPDEIFEDRRAVGGDHRLPCVTVLDHDFSQLLFEFPLVVLFEPLWLAGHVGGDHLEQPVVAAGEVVLDRRVGEGGQDGWPDDPLLHGHRHRTPAVDVRTVSN
mmetsp:Transcript_44790/g.139354  ORF Transcript_44790/g.139354 Transcript_44790/m.139354 type:complete len:585 (-) Transcript_44790:84-1838(-)